MQDFSYRYQNDSIANLVYYNTERKNISEKIIEYNDLKIKQSRLFNKLFRNELAIKDISNKINKLSSEIWGKKELWK